MSHQALFLSALVYLLAAVISVPVAKKLGLSSVLGYLVAGVIIGPFCFKLVGEEGADVMHFAEFGVVLMLFLVGLELRPSLLWKLRGPILGLGGAQVIVTAVLIAGIAVLCGLAWQMAIGVGMALALSSTAIVLQTLQEKGLMETTGGQSSFSVLLFQDIAVIPMLAVMPLLATVRETDQGHGDHGSDHHGTEELAFTNWISEQPGWVTTVLVLATVAAVIIGGRYLFQPILTIVAKTRVREVFVALALVLVIGVALWMSLLGVSPALGAFLAGVVLAESEYRHELESDIEPFKGILLGVFFISVGASIDFRLILSQPGTILAIVAGLMVLKAAVIFAIGHWGKLGFDQRTFFALALAQGGEFAFVLLGFGLTKGVFTNEVSQVLVASVALSMAVTPLVFLIEERVIRPRLGTRAAPERKPDDIEKRSEVILAGFGRFGNFVGRLLQSQNVPVTVIDHDADHIDFLREIGVEAYYGDASRHELLEAAGAEQAKLLIVTLEAEEKVNEIVAMARRRFPHLRILTRAASRQHLYELIEEQVDVAIHQHAGSASELGESALEMIGFRRHQAARAARLFRKHDWEATVDLAGEHRDRSRYIDKVRERLATLRDLSDHEAEVERGDMTHAWDTTALRAATSGAEDLEGKAAE
ncbi:MAG: monovalent cation:proton antiporter-2 (CPA2) family protein [Verrucomicrobiota bacterium]